MQRTTRASKAEIIFGWCSEHPHARTPCRAIYATPLRAMIFHSTSTSAQPNETAVTSLPLHQPPPLDSDFAARLVVASLCCCCCCCSPLALFSFEFGHLLDRFLDMVAVLGLKWVSRVLPA